MSGRPILPDVEIVRVLALIHPQLLNPRLEDVIVFLTLGAADDLADPGNQAVHRRDSLLVRVQLHIESLDLARIIRDEHRSFEDLLRQITLMFRLQIAAPVYLVAELVVVLLKHLHRIRVGHTSEIRGHDMVQSLQKSLVHEAVEEIHLLRCVLQDIVEDVLQHRLCQLHVILEICERNLRLDHPELRRMSGCIGVLRPEGWSECIDISKSLCKWLYIQLPGHGQMCRLTEEILRIVDTSVRVLRDILHVQRRCTEHLTCSFCIRCRDDRRMDIDKAPLLEELMDGICRKRSDAEGCLEQVGSRSKVRDRPHEFHRMSLLLHHNDSRSDVKPADICKIRKLLSEYDLKRLKKCSIVKHQESECLRCADRADPAADGDRLSDVGFPVPVDLLDCCKLYIHVCIPPEESSCSSLPRAAPVFRRRGVLLWSLIINRNVPKWKSDFLKESFAKSRGSCLESPASMLLQPPMFAVRNI